MTDLTLILAFALTAVLWRYRRHCRPKLYAAAGAIIGLCLIGAGHIIGLVITALWL